MTNIFNRQLGDGDFKDFGSAIEALRCAMATEAKQCTTDKDSRKYFIGEAEKCAKAKAIFDELNVEFRKKLSNALIRAGLDEFCECVDRDDYTLLHY